MTSWFQSYLEEPGEPWWQRGPEWLCCIYSVLPFRAWALLQSGRRALLHSCPGVRAGPQAITPLSQYLPLHSTVGPWVMIGLAYKQLGL